MKNIQTFPGLRKLLPITLLLLSFAAQAQQKYWVLLTDKSNVTFDPLTYFDPKAIERRVRHNLPLSHFTDWPLNQQYVQQVRAVADSVTNESRWLNAVACFANPEQVALLQQLPFVKEVVPMQSQARLAAAQRPEQRLEPDELELLRAQVQSLGGDYFRRNKIDGTGIRIAIFDAGFKGVDRQAAFEHIRRGQKIIKTWDFVRKREFVYDHSTHGTNVLSCIGGLLRGQPIGLATGAEFLLARTEKQFSEPFSEEDNWLAAVEWADKEGADIINSSLGYTERRYFQSQMDGRSSLVARAANTAARKGILVINAAGNDGTENWHMISTPADADSVLAVGGIDPGTFLHTDFSSFGPTADKRLKPNVSAFGHVMAAGPRGLNQTQGTSFASPLVAGFAACAWQANRTLTNMELFRQIEQSADLYPYFDYAHGYGVPQAGAFLGLKKTTAQPTFELVKQDSVWQVTILPAYFKCSPNSEAAEDPEYTPRPDYLFYHIRNSEGVLEKYFVLEVNRRNVLRLKPSEIGAGKTLAVFYKGYVATYAL